MRVKNFMKDSGNAQFRKDFTTNSCFGIPDVTGIPLSVRGRSQHEAWGTRSGKRVTDTSFSCSMFPVTDTRFPKTAGEFPKTAGEFPKTAGEFPKTSGEFPKTSGELPKTSGELPKTSGELPKTSGEFPCRLQAAQRSAE
jgi:hypothetical protein